MSFGSQTSGCDSFIFHVRSDLVFGSGSYILATLIHMPHGFVRPQFQMFVDCLFSQTWPSYEIAVFDRLQKCRLCGV
jgi:hypothetical protein